MEKLVQKSVRMPGELVEFVNSQPGNDFTSRLVRLLAEYKSGDQERRLMLQRYDEQIAERRERLDSLMDSINRVTLVSRRVEAVINEVELMEQR